MSQWGAYGLATKGWSHRRILTHFYSGTRVVTSSTLPRKLRVGLASGRSTIHLGARNGPVRLWLDGPGDTSWRRSRPGTLDGVGGAALRKYAVRDETGALGRRHPMGWSRAPAVRDVRRHRVTGLRARGRRRLAPGIRLRLRVPRVRSHRVRGPLRGAAHARAPVREVPPRHRGDAEQLAGRGVADPGRRRPDVRHVQDPAVRAPERLRLSPPRRAGDQVYVGWNKEIGVDGDRWVAAVSAQPGRSSGTRAP